MTIAERIKQKRKTLKLTQAELANRVGMSQQSLQKIENGVTRHPRKIIELAAKLECTAEWLMYGPTLGIRENLIHYENIEYKEDHYQENKRPLLSYSQAANWPHEVELNPSNTKWLRTLHHVSDDAFWLIVEGDSMHSKSGVSVPEGYLILVEPNQTAKSGDLVVAKLLEHNKVVFKKLIIDVHHIYLDSLNANYDQIKVKHGSFTIIGIVKQALQEF